VSLLRFFSDSCASGSAPTSGGRPQFATDVGLSMCTSVSDTDVISPLETPVTKWRSNSVSR
jgi:hypothetical protein